MGVPHICVVGAGQLGSRHLQALAKLAMPARITVVDPSRDSLSISKSRVEEIPGHEKHAIAYQSAIGKLGAVDLAIIATSANVRRSIVEDLLQENEVASLVLEKVLFQSAKDCVEVGRLLEEKGIQAWVNAPRRMWPFYRQLEEELSGDCILSIKQGAGNWGMACNTYHYLDIFSLLVGSSSMNLSANLLDRKLIESKRPGFKEIAGTLCGKFDCGTVFFISDYQDSAVPPTITIETNKRVFIIDEINQSIFPITGQPLPEKLVPVPKYQSGLTNLLAEEILTSGKCLLTPYAEASSLHQEMLKAFATVFAPKERQEEAICPIT